jgi:kanamycin kinase
MERKQIDLNFKSIPAQFHTLLAGATIYDSSSSPSARVLFIDKEGGFFLKSAAAGSLQQEAAMTAYFHGKGLSAQVLAYEAGEQDWLLTRALPGRDCLEEIYLAEPARLCDTVAELLRQLHETPCGDCPVKNRTAERLTLARKNYETGNFDRSLFPDNWGYASPWEAMAVLEELGGQLQANCLLHGDYCLPNILLDDWRLSGFIDVAAGGVGDRHMDLHWGLWSLWFNLKTDAYQERFLDAYGRDAVDEDLLRVVAAIEALGA